MYMKDLKNVFFGVVIATVLTIVFILIFSLILAKTNFNETYIDSVITIISGVSILIGTSVSTRKIKKRGAVVGALIAIIYSIILYVFSSVITNNYAINTGSIWMITVTTILGIIGGIIGINIKWCFLQNIVDIFFYLI